MSALKHAKLYRMVMPDHTCPYGLKSLDLLYRLEENEPIKDWSTGRDGGPGKIVREDMVL